MKSLTLAAIISTILLATTGVAQANEAGTLNHQFASKRAYYAPVENSKANQADAQFEGATYRPANATNQDGIATNKARHLKQLRINSFARRAYIG